MKKNIILLENNKISKKHLESFPKDNKNNKEKSYSSYSVFGSNLYDFSFIHNEIRFASSLISLKGSYMEKVGDMVYSIVKHQYPKYYNFSFKKLKDGNYELVDKHKHDTIKVRAFEKSATINVIKTAFIPMCEHVTFTNYGKGRIGAAMYLNKDRFTEKDVKSMMEFIKSLPVIYAGTINISKEMYFGIDDYKDLMKHRLIGCAIKSIPPKSESIKK